MESSTTFLDHRRCLSGCDLSVFLLQRRLQNAFVDLKLPLVYFDNLWSAAMTILISRNLTPTMIACLQSILVGFFRYKENQIFCYLSDIAFWNLCRPELSNYSETAAFMTIHDIHGCTSVQWHAMSKACCFGLALYSIDVPRPSVPALISFEWLSRGCQPLHACTISD